MASQVQALPVKSTNVRSVSEIRTLRERALQTTMELAARIAPDAAAGWAERMFLSPRRHARPAWEQEWAARAERGEVRYRTQLLPTYSWGHGPSVLLVHGWEGRGTQLAGFIPALLAAGYRVVAVDLPGHGDADAALTSVADFAHALRTVIQRLGPFQGIVAHSAGAAASALSFTLTPFAARLVMVGAPRGPQRFFAAFTDYLGLSAGESARVAKRIEQRYRIAFEQLDVEAFGARVDVPTLLIHDRGDREVPFEHALAIAAQLPQAQLMATDGLGHRRILRDAAVIEAAVSFVTRET